jgi:hypothetical protein
MKKKKKIDCFVIGVILYWLTFVTAMTVIFCVKGSVPDTLIQFGLGGGAVELACTAAIEILSNKKGAKNE